MDLGTFRRLLTPEGQKALAAAVELAPTVATLLACHTRLRKHFAGELVKAALETALLRRRASEKFTRSDHMYFTREGLEQASGELISTYRAKRFASFKRVGDLCCGIGGDSIALSSVADVVAVDTDAVRLALAAENLRAYDRDRATWTCADVLTMALPELDAAYIDPDRRVGGRRHVRIRDYGPPLDAVRARLPAGFPLAVKAAPGAPWDELRTFDAEAEFISVAGELKECVLWFGPLRTTSRRATVLPTGATIAADRPIDTAEAGPPLGFLYDPDPAVVRSGLVADLGVLLDARPIDPEIAYLASDRFAPTPFAQGYRIEEAMPFHGRELGNRLQSMNVGTATITKRGSAVDVDELRHTWRLKGPEDRTVILTRVLGKPFALIGIRLGNGTNAVI